MVYSPTIWSVKLKDTKKKRRIDKLRRGVSRNDTHNTHLKTETQVPYTHSHGPIYLTHCFDNDYILVYQSDSKRERERPEEYFIPNTLFRHSSKVSTKTHWHFSGVVRDL